MLIETVRVSLWLEDKKSKQSREKMKKKKGALGALSHKRQRRSKEKDIGKQEAARGLTAK